VDGKAMPIPIEEYKDRMAERRELLDALVR
jgi:hypothetical protein